MSTGCTHAAALFGHLLALVCGFGAVVVLDFYGAGCLTGRRGPVIVARLAASLDPLIWGRIVRADPHGRTAQPRPYERAHTCEAHRRPRCRLARAMVTTAVFAEIIVAGLQAATWITLVVFAIFGFTWADPAPISDWAALVTLLVLAAAYMLGVMIDRLADNLVLRLNRYRPPRPVDKPTAVEDMRMAILAKDDGVARFLDYQRSRMRIARVTLLNLLLLIPAIVAFLLLRTDAGIVVVTVVLLVSLYCAALAMMVYRNIECAYISRLSEVYRRANAIPDTNIAAAVCCDRSSGRLTFGLVQTSDGGRWTFPKGHKRRSETLPEAAVREAVEEAGVSGRIDGTRLLAYRYPTSRRGKVDDDIVAAFMLTVSGVGPPTEPGRALIWCDLEEARAKLGENREPIYAQEMERVLLAAEDQPEW